MTYHFPYTTIDILNSLSFFLYIPLIASYSSPIPKHSIQPVVSGRWLAGP